MLAAGAFAYVAYLVQLTSFPFEDYPNHLARATVMVDLLLHDGASFGSFFSVHLEPVPYVLGDLVLAGSIGFFGLQVGAGLFTALVVLSLPAALLVYARANDLSRAAGLFAAAVGLVLATDWFFLMGFMSFRLGLALLILIVAAADRWRRSGSAPALMGFAAALLAGYLTHLTVLVFAAPIIGLSSLLRLATRQSGWRSELALWACLTGLLLLHFTLLAPHDLAPTRVVFGTWRAKLAGLDTQFYRFGGRPYPVLLFLLAAALLAPIIPDLRAAALRRPAVLEQLALAMLFLAIYAILPSELTVAFVDVRALPLVSLFLLLAVVRWSDPLRYGGRSLWALLAVLLAANLGYLALHLQPADREVARYRRTLSAVPPGSLVLPVYTREEASILPLLHADAFLVLDRAAVTPYLFSAERGDPMTYFHFTVHAYVPHERWYEARRESTRAAAATTTRPAGVVPWYAGIEPIDWARVECDYRYLIVTLPFDAAWVPPARSPLAQTAVAALYPLPRGG